MQRNLDIHASPIDLIRGMNAMQVSAWAKAASKSAAADVPTACCGPVPELSVSVGVGFRVGGDLLCR
jgi:hypothetical protein